MSSFNIYLALNTHQCIYAMHHGFLVFTSPGANESKKSHKGKQL